MTTQKFLAAYLLTAGLMVAGCGQPAPTSQKADPKAATKGGGEENHDHDEGPHGGTVMDFGKYHAEFTVDHKAKAATVYILDGKVKNAVPVAAAKLLLSIKAPSFQTDLVAAPQDGDPKGKASRFVAKHDNFGKEQEFEGILSGEVDGKQYAVEFKEEAHKDHKHTK